MKTKILLILILTSFVLLAPKNTHAQEEETVKCMQWEDAQLAEGDTNVVSTNIGTALAQLDTASFFVSGDDTCDIAEKASKCVEDGTVTNCELAPVSSSNSSVLGLTGTARAVANGDVIPVNFAYYFRDQVKNVPIVGDKVYAQDSYTDIYGASIALAIWKAFRNIALGLMSIFLIVIGIMIILRKKVDPRTVLTLQAALPKVIISMVLIVFSFAIGALFIRFVPAARGMAATIFDTATNDLTTERKSNQPEVTFTVSAFAILGIIGGYLISGPGLAIGAFTAIIGVITAIVWLVILLMVYLRTVIIYVRMLVHTVTAPFQFAVGAIPGNDAMIINWFKKMIAWLISIPAMYFLIQVAEFVQLYALQSTFFGNDVSGFANTAMPNFVQSTLQQLFLLLVSPFISMMLLVQALTVPKKVEGYIVGEPKRR